MQIFEIAVTVFEILIGASIGFISFGLVIMGIMAMADLIVNGRN